MKTKNVKTLLTGLISSTLIFLPACQVGLGEAIDLVGPTVNILTPNPRQCVQSGGFEITGKATDNTGVAELIVTCDGNTWKNTDGKWTKKLKNDTEFSPDNNSEWNSTGEGKSVEWKVKNVTINQSGTYEIVVQAADKTRSPSSDARKARFIIVDTEAPRVTVSNPAMRSPNDFNDSDYKKISVVSKYVTGDFTLSGSAVDENEIKYIDILITDPVVSPQDPATAQKYYEARLVQDEGNADGKTYIKCSSLRAWDINIKLSDLKKTIGNTKTKLQVWYIAEDSSGHKTSGYSLPENQTNTFCIWKDADTPWIELNLGASQSSPLSVYAGTTLLGNACDGTAISEVTASILKTDGTPVSPEWNNKKLYPENAADGIASQASSLTENNVFFQISVPKDCAVYKIVVNTKDNNGKAATTKTGWIKVEDKTFPSVDVIHKVNNVEQAADQSLFGNQTGNFTFDIASKDDTQVKALKIAYITTPDDIVELSDINSSKWNNVGSDKSDLKTGKVLSLTPTDTGRTESESGIIRKIYSSTLDLNLFDDLGIGQTFSGKMRTLSNQCFMFRVEDGNGNAITKDYTILGDIQSPTVTFKKIRYKNKDYTSTSELLPAFGENASATVYGSISDDSFLVWNDISKLKFSLWCNDTEIPASDITLNSNGSFESTVNNLIGSSLNFKATVTDLAKNQTPENFTFLVDTQTTTVEYFHSSKDDGCYRTGTIPIKLRFNKQLKFSGSSMPVITLNNNKTATMSTPSSTGDREFVFNYTISAGDDTGTEKLNVKSIDLKGGKLYDVNNSEWTTGLSAINDAIAAGSGKNLADIKEIYIITSVPEITSWTLDEDAGILTINFNKKIAKGDGEITITQQGDIYAPAYLLKADYDRLTALEPGLATHYTEGSNGTNSSYETDITPKYVLNYEDNVSDTTMKTLYANTNNHIITRNVKSNTSTIPAATPMTLRIKTGSLPCKGAEYKIVIPEGLVLDYVGKADYKSAAKTVTYTSKYIEKPVIRIKTEKPQITSSYKADHSNVLTSEFKIDCMTAGATITYSYLPMVMSSPSTGSKDGCTRQNWTNQTRVNGTYSAPVNLGKKTDGTTYDYKNGLKYQIYAEASKNSVTSDKSYAAAARTTIRFEKVQSRLNEDKMKQDYTNWNYSTYGSNGIGVFLRGGDNLSSDNTVQGLPTNWDTTTEEGLKGTLLMQKDPDNDRHYIVSWNLTSPKYFFKISAGLMDSKTLQGWGPKQGVFGQNDAVPGYQYYYSRPGEYITIPFQDIDQGGSFAFDMNSDKCQTYR